MPYNAVQYMVAMVVMQHAIYTEHWIALICPLTGQQKLVVFVYYVITQLIMIMQYVIRTHAGTYNYTHTSKHRKLSKNLWLNTVHRSLCQQ